MYRRIPIACQFFIQSQESDGTTGHLQRCNVAANQRTSDSNISAAQNLGEFVSDDIEFNQRCAAHAIDKSQDWITCSQAKVFDDRYGKHLGNLGSRGKFHAATTRLAMNTNTYFHLIIA